MTTAAPPRDPWFPAPGDPVLPLPKDMEPVIREQWDFTPFLMFNISLGTRAGRGHND
jgi:hypothetical protein